MSLAHANRRQLESLGDYVTRAKIGWFAVFPKKLTKLQNIATANNRAANLIVYRITPTDERFHYAIPMDELKGLLVDATQTHSQVNGISRWNITLRNHILKVSHNNLRMNVKQYFQVALAVELQDHGDAQVCQVDLNPPGRVVTTTYRILRDTALARQLKADHDYRCQICDTTIVLPDGSRYAEAHHVRPLGTPHHGLDCRANMIVLCPNHHAMCDYGVIQLSQPMLRQVAGHVIDTASLQYHNTRVYRPTAPGAVQAVELCEVGT